MRDWYPHRFIHRGYPAVIESSIDVGDLEVTCLGIGVAGRPIGADASLSTAVAETKARAVIDEALSRERAELQLRLDAISWFFRTEP